LLLVVRFVDAVFRFAPCVLLFPPIDPKIVWEFGGGKNTDRKLGSAIPIRYGLCKDWDWEFPLVTWISDVVQVTFFGAIFDRLGTSSSLSAIISSSLSSIIWLSSFGLFACWDDNGAAEGYENQNMWNLVDKFRGIGFLSYS
jgi:hypothetical protein